MKKNSRLKSFFAILLAGSMIFQQSSLTVLATDDTYVEDATATPTPSESEAEAYTTEGAEPVAEKQEEPQQVQETPAAEQAQEPTEAPAEQPTEAPAEQPTEAPAEQPTEAPAAAPTETPATEPTAAPAAEVTEAPAAPEATATPAAEATATPTPEVSASPSETPTPTEAPKTSFRYEDSRVVITATAPEDANLPQDAEIKADYIAPGTERYNAAVAAFNSQLSSQLGLDAENTEAEYVLYDVYFLTADGSRIEPESGNVKVDMSFKQIQKSTIDGDVVNKDVVHLDNEGQAEVVTDYVNTNENGEVTGMGFTQGSFSIVGGVTVYDAESGTPSVVVPVSDNLNEFLDTAEIVNGEYENGKLVIKPGSIYEFKLSFKEKGTTLQYDDSKETLEYTFDSDLTPEVVNGSGTIKGTENGIPYSVGFTYTIENNKVKIKIDKTDPNYQELIKASNAKLEINLKAKVSETISKVDTTFWTKVNKDILIDKSSSVTIDKQGTYDEENGKFDYVVTVTAKGNPKDITVTDTISGSLLKLTGNIEVESSKTGKTVDGSFDTDKKTESGFTYKIKQMTDNEKIAFKYSATVDRSGKKDGEKFTKDETSNKVTATGKEIPNVEKEHSFENTTVYDYPISKSGELTGEVTSDGKQTITWTIIVNEGAKYNVGGSLVTDKLGNTANVTLEYSGDGLTIQRMDENNVDSGKAFPVLWKDLKEYSSKDHWKYELPADDKAYAYKITYTTVADVSKLISDGKTVTNDVDFKGNHEKGTVPVGPKDDSFKVDKTHGEFDKNSIHYTVTVNVPKAGFEKYLKITDTLPGYNNNGWQADEYIDKTLEIKLDGKTIPSGNYKVTYVKSSNQQGGKLEVLFEEEAVNKLFSKSETEKTLTITYKTKPGWTGSQPHYNTVKVEAENGSKEDTDSVIVADRTIVKEFVSEEKAKDGLPVYCFRVFLTGVDKETIELEDSFDKSLLELYEGKDKIDQWNPNADQYDKPHFGGGDEDYTAFNNANGTSINGEVVEHTPTENGIKFKLKASKKEGGNDYYGYYCLRYKLKVIDEDALAKIIANAKNDNNGVYTMANTASWGTDSASATVDYKYGAVTKSVVKATLANGYKATYSIKINEGKQLLNNGEKMLLEDFLNLGTDDSPNSMVFLPNSFKIFFDGVEQSNYHINYDETSKKLSFYVPDATKVEIQYDVKIVGTGDVKYSNYAVLKGQYSSDVVSESTNISSSGTGSAEHFGINIYKYGSDDITKGLKNVKFKLYVKENDSFVPVTEIVGNKRVQVEVTTNDQGYAVLNGTVGANGWEMEIGKTYKLEESSTPTGYKKSEPIIFTTSYNSTSADIQTPNSTINVENEKVKTGKLTVKKSVEAPEGFNAKREYEFTVTDTAGNQYNASGKQEAGAVIRLKDGGSVTLENLPEGTYTVIEKTAGEEGYLWKSEVTVTGKNTEEATTASAEVTDGNETTVSFKNTYKKFTEVELQLNAKKNLTGRALTEDEFEFLVTSENKVGLTLPGKIFTNDKNGNIVITGIVFSEEGRYILTVEEKKGENAGITYDSTKYNVTVNVKANAEGDLKTEIESIKKKGEEKNENQIVFNNIYTATANFTLTASKSMKAESEQLGTFEFELSGDNIETQTVTNNEAGAITFAPIHYNLSDVGNTYTYTVREKAPSTEPQYKTDGIKYVYDTTVYTVKVKVEDNGDGTLKLTKTVKIGENDYTDPEMRFVNDTTKATITKVDALGNQLSGVELEVRDKNNEVVDSWTTSTKENPHVITGKLILGETYKLVEKSAPAGYTLADPVEFTVSENDIDNKVEMKNTYSASGSLNLTAKKTLTTTETPLAADQFTFELRDKDGTVLQTKTNDADGNVTFDEIKYSLVKDNTDKKVDDTGEYQYTVNEVKGDAAGYTYDDTIYTINVTVTDAGNGTLTVTPVIHSSKATSEDATVTGMEFTNTYTTSGQIALGAIKTLEGQTLEAEQFSFQATEMDADGKAVENGYNETVKNADGGAITFPIITYKESGTHYYQITEVKDEKPAYQYDESKYVVKVDVTDDNAGKLTAKVTSVTKNGEPVKSEDLTGAVTFTNTYSASADLELKAQKSMKVEAEQLGTFEFELKDADGKVIETVKNDEKGAISFSKLSYTEKDAGKTFTYTVNEKLPSEADTYVYDKTVYTVTVNVEDNRDGTLKLTTKVNGEDYTETAMKFVNDTTKVTISKVDDTTLKALAGAKLQVVDDQDKVVEEWTSDGTPHVITAKLVLGKTYKLVEAEAPSGYEIAEPITFTVDADDTKNAVEMKDAMTKGKTAAIEITKELKLNDALAGAKDMTFYAALFADAECTIPASDVKALEFKNASSSTVTFTNLDLGRTYYVSETDATGKAIDSGMTPDEKVYVPVYPQGQAITVTEDGAKSSITFENQFSEWPDGFYKIATLNVTKKLLGADGNALESDEIFYAGIFDDKECTTLSTRTEKNILTLDLAGGSTVSESTQAVVIPDEAFTLYVAETDAEGNLVDGTDGFRYAVTVENGNVLFDENNLNAEVTIINQEQPEATPTVTPEETITPTPTPGTSTGVKTGDDTPIGFYMALLFVAALAIEETTRRRRKKEQD